MQLSNSLLNIERLDKHLAKYYEIKDPSVVKIAEHSYMMYASIGNSEYQEWIVGRFEAQHPDGKWKEIEPVSFNNLYGPQLCAPAVTYVVQDGVPEYRMYIQTACFEEDGQIVLATSRDGQNFFGHQSPLVTRNDVLESNTPVVGVYDVGVSEVKTENAELLCMVYSGYRKVGCGDLYMSYKNKSDNTANWSKGERLIAQEEVPFHNRPDYEHFEWGLEGAKLIQMAKDCFVIIGVCFMPKPEGFLGTRQRVFMAASSKLNGPYTPIGLPFLPSLHNGLSGENGHPDTLIEGDTLWVIYQEREGDKKPWHLRTASFHLPALENFIRQRLTTFLLHEEIKHRKLDDFHFTYAQQSFV